MTTRNSAGEHDKGYRRKGKPMTKIVPNTFCLYSNITFSALVDELNDEFRRLQPGRDTMCVMFTDGDAATPLRVNPACRKTFFIVSLVRSVLDVSPSIHAGADLVVSKKIHPAALKQQMLRALKARETNRFRPAKEWKRKCASITEQQVLALLLHGYPTSQVAERMNLTVQAVSRYRILAVKRAGLRNFNELVLDHIKYNRVLPALSEKGSRVSAK